MPNENHDVIIIGAGAAGLMCAVKLGERGVHALVLEGQDRPARKLLITGGGRCNVTNASVEERDFGTHGPRIVRHVLQVFPSKSAVRFFEDRGIALAIEEERKYFTADGRATKVVDTLVQAAAGAGAELACGHAVEDVSRFEDIFEVRTTHGVFRAPCVVVATGGLSYPSTGSTGKGLEIARKFGHKVLPTGPALTPFLSRDSAYGALAGLTLSARLALWSAGKKISEYEGSFLFTHVGFSGPVVLDMSRDWQKAPADRILLADLVPAVPVEKIEDVLMDSTSRTGVMTRLGEIFPRRLAGFLVGRAGVDGELPANIMKRDQRKHLLALIKEHPLPVSAAAGFDKAEVTFGGVDLRELQGASLESKLQPGLFFAGEVLDVDGRVGGFNLQWAWASGAAVAQAIVQKQKR